MISSTPSAILGSENLNQFLQLHGYQAVFRYGSPVQFGPQAFSGWTELTSTPVTSASFVATGSTLSWLRLPLCYNPPATGSLTETGTAFASPTDVYVSVYSGTSDLLDVVVPLEQLTAVQSGKWPEPQGVMLGAPVAANSATVLPLPDFFDFSGCTAGNFAIVGGGTTSLAVQNTTIYVAPYLGNGELGTWLTGSTPPAGLDEFDIVYSPNTGCLCLVGGFGANGLSNLVVTAALANTGVIGGWQTQAVLPEALSQCSLVVATLNNVDYLYVFGGNNGAWVSTGYVAEIGSNGSITSWSTCAAAPMPEMFWTANGSKIYGMSISDSSIVWMADISQSLTGFTWQMINSSSAITNPIVGLNMVGSDLVAVAASSSVIQPFVVPLSSNGALDWTLPGESVTIPVVPAPIEYYLQYKISGSNVIAVSSVSGRTLYTIPVGTNPVNLRYISYRRRDGYGFDYRLSSKVCHKDTNAAPRACG